MEEKKYKYQCTACGEIVELDEPMTPDFVCPVCGMGADMFVEIN